MELKKKLFIKIARGNLMEIVRDKNNFPIELGDIVILYKERKDLYGLIGIVRAIDIAIDHCTVIEVLIDDTSNWACYMAGPEEIEVIDSLKQSLFNGFNTSVSLPFHQACKYEESPRCFNWKNLETKKFLKKFEKDHGFIPQPRRFPVISISWSERGKGFGEYQFWQDGDQIHCANECDSKETIKRVLCQMVDQAILDDPR
jgi:hypothetical protein